MNSPVLSLRSLLILDVLPMVAPSVCKASKKATKSQKNPRVRKIFVRNSGAGNGCANFMDAWKKCVRSAGKTTAIKFLVLGGGILGLGGGGEVPILFYGREDFSEREANLTPQEHRAGSRKSHHQR